MLVVFCVRLFWNVASHVQILNLFYRLEKLEELDVNTNNLEVYKDFIMGICVLHSDKDSARNQTPPPNTAHTLSKETKVIRYCLYFHGRYSTTIIPPKSYLCILRALALLHTTGCLLNTYIFFIKHLQ